jgi:hypothetical protein
MRGILGCDRKTQLLLGLCLDQCTNYAVGGATTSTTNGLAANVPGLAGLQQQIDKFKYGWQSPTAPLENNWYKSLLSVASNCNEFFSNFYLPSNK